ncbi:hypothetical protein EYR40_008559 [Pleurotus pulmonarius]|nr:hypothetical protein EYR36_009378 [Pleurotus pulmonarius]KAF4592875.1 hypothetical protein EYR38_008581 [Pleurotus pulmonarius]KAF4593765.1 hypothetical protein EYR40_008559 [Pleurotus pulmonarius]
MHFNLFSYFICCYLLLPAQVFAYFVVTSPAEGTVWHVGAANPITWSKGVMDGINSFDIEMNRMSGDGLHFIARNVPNTMHSLNVFLQDVPPGDDYFLLFVNSTHGVLHTTSKRFSVVSSDSGASPDSNAPTVTISGAPNPTQAFATTYAAVPNGAIDNFGVPMLGMMALLFGWISGILCAL